MSMKILSAEDIDPFKGMKGNNWNIHPKNARECKEIKVP